MGACKSLLRCFATGETRKQVCPVISMSQYEAGISVECFNGVLATTQKGKTLYKQRSKVYRVANAHRSINRSTSVRLSVLIRPKRAVIRRAQPLQPHSALVASTRCDIVLQTRGCTQEFTSSQLDIEVKSDRKWKQHGV